MYDKYGEADDESECKSCQWEKYKDKKCGAGVRNSVYQVTQDDDENPKHIEYIIIYIKDEYNCKL